MKKKYVAIISISTISLIFGGLVYCGISAFPELLEPEEEQVEQKAKHHLAIEPTFVNQVYDNSSSDVVVVSGGAGAGSASFEGFVSNPVNTGAKISFVDKENNPKVSAESFKEARHKVEHPFFEERSDVSFLDNSINGYVAHEEKHVAKETHYYGSSKKETSVSPVTTVNKAINVPTNKSANKEITECSLLVIAAVDLISMLLIVHKKRRLLR